jgi:Fe2+ or Zn2+ uptake regulation protein
MPSVRRARSSAGARPRTAPPPHAARAVRSPGDRLEEDPHAHIVCRVCGRIQGLELTELDRHLLTELSALTPDGWSVERIAYSLAGACRRCREGPPVG